MAKIVQNGITYGSSFPLVYKDITSTLASGETSLTISDSAIVTASTIDIDTGVIGIRPTSVTISNGSIVLTFESQDSDVLVRIRVY